MLARRTASVALRRAAPYLVALPQSPRNRSAGWQYADGPRIGLAVYLLIAAAAGFVTASRNLLLPVLFLVIIALGVVAVLIRRQVLGLGGTTRVAIAFLAVYLLTFFLVRFLTNR